MKVTPPNSNVPQQSAPNANRATTARRVGPVDNSPPGGEEDAGAVGGGPGRDFASVLKDVTRTRDEQSESERDGGSEPREGKGSERAAAGREARRREERRDDGLGGGFQQQQQGGVREAGWGGEAAGARAILDTADLERIVAAVRTHVTVGGQREVTLELHRSVLEGLRIKLSADAAGRVTAEFVAATESVRAQLDARSADLADLLRSRGVALAALRTSVAGDSRQDASSGGGGGNREYAQGSFASLTERIAGPAKSPAPKTDADDGSAVADDGSTYRA